jgi:putative colanic acid biosynthesis acetyltransferase WcaF
MQTDLSIYDNGHYKPGPLVKRVAWFMVSLCFFKNPLLPFYGFKVFLLKLFGAGIGRGVVIKPGAGIKYPWFLEIGNHCWIGENVWIDNLAMVTLGNNVCISQGAMLLCGNHDYTKTTFDLLVKPIVLEDGAWVGAKSVVCAGVTCGTHSVLTVASVAVHSLDAYSINQGNPAVKVKMRVITQ